MLIRRDAFMRVGLFDESLAIAEFIDWMARAIDAKVGTVVLPQVLVRRRLHGSNTSSEKRDARPNFARALKAALDRRRKSPGAFADES